MGYVHHSQYLVYYEYARLEYLRELGMSYKEIEEDGILMPVISAKLDFIQPAFYDDVLTISTNLNINGAKFIFRSEIRQTDDKLINTGEIEVVCIDSSTRKPVKPLKIIIDSIHNIN
jgi:acyl-CoA thioester hydrolase